MNLLDFLLEHHGEFSRNKLKSLLTRGMIEVDGEVQTRYDFQVTPQSRVVIVHHEEKGSPRGGADRNMRLFARIVYEDRRLLVIDKRVGVLSVPSGHHGFCLKTLLDEYLQRKGERCTAHIVHRLDKETSGLMLFAKSRDVQAILTDNWRDIITDRRYYAVTSGIPAKSSATLRSWLTDDKFYYTHSSPTDNGGKLAITHYHILATASGRALLDVKLETGRKNQIRVHLQDIGCPVIGDLKYGNGDDPAHRLGLHAFRLCFRHPVQGKVLEFETPLPSALEKILFSPTLRP